MDLVCEICKESCEEDLVIECSTCRTSIDVYCMVDAMVKRLTGPDPILAAVKDQLQRGINTFGDLPDDFKGLISLDEDGLFSNQHCPVCLGEVFVDRIAIAYMKAKLGLSDTMLLQEVNAFRDKNGFSYSEYGNVEVHPEELVGAEEPFMNIISKQAEKINDLQEKVNYYLAITAVPVTPAEKRDDDA